MVSLTGIPTDYNPSVFHRELKNIYGIVPFSPTDNNPSVFHRELKKIYRIVPLSPTDLPTDKNLSEFHRELQNNYEIVPQSPTSTPTVLPTYNTDRITDGFTHIPKRTHVWHVSVCTNTDGFTDVQYRQIYAHPEAHACLTRVRLDKYRWFFRRIEKSGGIFKLFLCAFQLISDGITDGI